MVAVALSGEAYTAMRLSSGHEIGSTTVRRGIAPQPVLTCYKLLEIERIGHRDCLLSLEAQHTINQVAPWVQGPSSCFFFNDFGTQLAAEPGPAA